MITIGYFKNNSSQPSEERRYHNLAIAKYWMKIYNKSCTYGTWKVINS